jgi:hypothetical protein
MRQSWKQLQDSFPQSFDQLSDVQSVIFLQSGLLAFVIGFLFFQVILRLRLK